MPVTKFRSIEEAEKALLLDPERGSAERLRLFFDFTMMLKKISPPKTFPRGVKRFRSIEEKNEEEEQREKK